MHLRNSHLGWKKLLLDKRGQENLEEFVEKAEGEAYRIIKALYMKTPLSVRGSLQGGRYNVPNFHKDGFSALYLSTTEETALSEIKQNKALKETRLILPVSYRFKRSLNLNSEICTFLKINASLLLENWKPHNLIKKLAPTQQLAFRLHKVKIEALFVPSVRNKSGTNIVVFPENLLEDSFVRIKDQSKVFNDMLARA